MINDKERILNLEKEGNRYVEFHGDGRVTIPSLLEEGRIPITVADTIRRRVEVLEMEVSERIKKKLVSGWLKYPIDTSDGVLLHPNGSEFKIILNAPYIQRSNLNTPLKAGYVIIGDNINPGPQTFVENFKEHYVQDNNPTIDGFLLGLRDTTRSFNGFTDKDREKSLEAYQGLEGKIITLDEYKCYEDSVNVSSVESFVAWLAENPFWKTLVRGDTDLLMKYAESVHKAGSNSDYSIYDKFAIAYGVTRYQPISVMQVCIPTTHNYNSRIFTDEIALGGQLTVLPFPLSQLMCQPIMDPHHWGSGYEPNIIGINPN